MFHKLLFIILFLLFLSVIEVFSLTGGPVSASSFANCPIYNQQGQLIMTAVPYRWQGFDTCLICQNAARQGALTYGADCSGMASRCYGLSERNESYSFWSGQCAPNLLAPGQPPLAWQSAKSVFWQGSGGYLGHIAIVKEYGYEGGLEGLRTYECVWPYCNANGFTSKQFLDSCMIAFAGEK